jgi:hypothetical protein
LRREEMRETGAAQVVDSLAELRKNLQAVGALAR